jgi:hypothetical protein
VGGAERQAEKGSPVGLQCRGVTLALQVLVLPLVVRWARPPADTAVEEERRLAETVAA